MKRKYKFYDKEAITPTEITFDFPQPFYENLDAHLKSIYNILFIKEINHNSKIIRLHNPYDSGKGMRYVPFSKKEKCELSDLSNWTPPKPIDVSNYTVEDLEQICVNGEKDKAIRLYGKFLIENNCMPDMPNYIGEVIKFIENPTLIKNRIEYLKANKSFF